MKGRGRPLVSLGVAALIFALSTALSGLIFRVIDRGAALESRNDVERTMNLLLAGLRDHADFDSAIESMAPLRDKVVGVAAYSATGQKIYSWGLAPERYAAPLPREAESAPPPRVYGDLPARDSISMLFRPFRPLPPSTEGRRDFEGRDRRPPPSFLSTTLRSADLVYIEVREPEYWRSRRIESILFALVELAIAALILFVRGLLLRNAEYRRRIDEQKNLVVLGTAASTIAHEIKNPLLSIKLQTRILEKTSPPGAHKELGIINDEVERLSALSLRVGDYLRDPAGNPRPIDPAEVALEVGLRICGRNILRVAEAPPPIVDMDPERLRSVLENLVRNALEAEGPEEGLSIEAGAEGRLARIEVLDRGGGLAPEAMVRLFDPFFTTKSRGTGIGLSVCKRFVEAAGGSIELGPRDGGGCRARILLPAAGGGR